VAQTAGVTVREEEIQLDGGEEMAAVSFGEVPRNAHIRLQGKAAPTPRFGVRVRERAPFVDGVTLDVLVAAQRIELHDAAINAVPGLYAPFKLEIIVKDDLVDVCVNEHYCLINRCPEQDGTTLTLFCHTGSVVFNELMIRPLMD
jgi:hypothetical protein